MKTRYIAIFLTIIFSTFIFSCEKKAKERSVNADSLAARLVVLQDSLDASWKRMIKADEEKVMDIKNWLVKINKIKKQPLVAFDTLNGLVIKLSQVKYSQADISINAVDKNDSVSTEIMNRIIKIKESIPNLKNNHPEEEAMFSKIQKADNDVVTDRIKYQGYVLEYNSIVKNYGKEIMEKKKEFKDLKFKKGFQADSTQGI